MACGAVSMAILAFLASALLLLSSVPTVASTNSSPSPVLKDVCQNSSRALDLKKCLATLGSERGVAAAKDLRSILIAILEAGISHATETRSYVQKLLKQPGLKPGHLYAMKECYEGYDVFIWSFNSARLESIDKDYDTASYDIKIAYTDYIDRCRDAMSSKNVTDAEISKGNDFTDVFGQVAFDTACRLPSED